jgi:hypothetical protein
MHVQTVSYPPTGFSLSVLQVRVKMMYSTAKSAVLQSAASLGLSVAKKLEIRDMADLTEEETLPEVQSMLLHVFVHRRALAALPPLRAFITRLAISRENINNLAFRTTGGSCGAIGWVSHYLLICSCM